MASRHLSRSIVLQTLFECDFLTTNKLDVSFWTEEKIKEILNKNLKEFAPGLEDNNFIFSLIDEILEKKNEIDEIIEKAAPDWPLDKISIIDRNILRIGLVELLFGDRREVPAKVAINEAIELAKTFGGENSGKFINGVLGNIYKEIGEPGKDEKSKKKNNNNEPVDITKLPVEKFGGAVIYSANNNEIFVALVHDVFGYWTLSKGHIDEGEDEQDETIKRIKEEINLDIKIETQLGENEYVASHPEKGKILKKVIYYLASSEKSTNDSPLKLKNSGGLDDTKWFKLSEISELRIYNDIIPIITKAVEIISTTK